MTAAVMIAAALAACAASRNEQVVVLDGCADGELRVLAFDAADACTTEDPSGPGGSATALADSGWMGPEAAPQVEIPPDTDVALVAQCRDAAGIVRSWGCDDETDGLLDLVLQPTCRSDCASGDCPVGSDPWSGGGGAICVAQCDACRDGCAGVQCGDGARCVDGACVGEDPCVDVECEDGLVCSNGTCVAGGV